MEQTKRVMLWDMDVKEATEIVPKFATEEEAKEYFEEWSEKSMEVFPITVPGVLRISKLDPDDIEERESALNFEKWMLQRVKDSAESLYSVPLPLGLVVNTMYTISDRMKNYLKNFTGMTLSALRALKEAEEIQDVGRKRRHFETLVLGMNMGIETTYSIRQELDDIQPLVQTVESSLDHNVPMASYRAAIALANAVIPTLKDVRERAEQMLEQMTNKAN